MVRSGRSDAHCADQPPTTPAPTPPPIAPSPTPIAQDHSRLIAYLGNWQACPSVSQVEKYTHIVIAFAVSYTWSPGKNICNTQCEIATPPICNNAPNQALVQQWQQEGKKVLLSFGGAGMGGSWDGVNDCWEYCYGKEEQVINRLVDIVNELGLDGIDLDFEYFVTSEAVSFLNDLNIGLRAALPPGSEITHAPMDSDIIPGEPYYDDILMSTGHLLDFLMPQYYNGATRPVSDGIDGSGAGQMSALVHYNTIVNNIYGGDPNRMVFGFCISDCVGTGSNANGQQAALVMSDLAYYHSCNGGAFFWVAAHDTGGSWSSTVGNTIFSLSESGCTSSPTPMTTVPTPDPTAVNQTPAPTPIPTKHPTPMPTQNILTPEPTPASPDKCCQPNENKMKAYNGCTQYYQCSWGNIVPELVGPPGNGALFDESFQNWNWPGNFVCYVDPCGGPGPSPTLPPTPSPQPPTNGPTNPCCPSGYYGLRAWNNCLQYYHCVNGVVTGEVFDVPDGTLFDQNIQNFNWANQVTCVVDNCGRRLRGVSNENM